MHASTNPGIACLQNARSLLQHHKKLVRAGQLGPQCRARSRSLLGNVQFGNVQCGISAQHDYGVSGFCEQGSRSEERAEDALCARSPTCCKTQLRPLRPTTQSLVSSVKHAAPTHSVASPPSSLCQRCTSAQRACMPALPPLPLHSYHHCLHPNGTHAHQVQQSLKTHETSLCACSGALGNGFTEDVLTPQQTGVAWRSAQAPVLAAGMWHSGAIVDGVVYTWGKGKGGRLGLGDESQRNAPERVDLQGGVLLQTRQAAPRRVSLHIHCLHRKLFRF